MEPLYFTVHGTRTFLAFYDIAVLTLIHSLQRGRDEGPRLRELCCDAGRGLEEGGGCRRSERGDEGPPRWE